MTSTTDAEDSSASYRADGRLPLGLLWRTALALLWATRGRTWPAFLAMAAVIVANYVAMTAILETTYAIPAALGAMLLVQAAVGMAGAGAMRSMLGMRRRWALTRGLGVYIVLSVVLGLASSLLFSVISAPFAAGVGRLTVAGLIVVLVLSAMMIGVQALSIRLTLWLVGSLLDDVSASYRNSIARMRGATGAGVALWVLVFGGCLVLAYGAAWACERAFGVAVDNSLTQTIAILPCSVIFVAAGAALWRLCNGSEALAGVFD